jgi:hypothetical protein
MKVIGAVSMQTTTRAGTRGRTFAVQGVRQVKELSTHLIAALADMDVHRRHDERRLALPGASSAPKTR